MPQATPRSPPRRNQQASRSLRGHRSRLRRGSPRPTRPAVANRGTTRGSEAERGPPGRGKRHRAPGRRASTRRGTTAHHRRSVSVARGHALRISQGVRAGMCGGLPGAWLAAYRSVSATSVLRACLHTRVPYSGCPLFSLHPGASRCPYLINRLGFPGVFPCPYVGTSTYHYAVVF